MRKTMTIVLGALCVVALTGSADAATKKPKKSCAEACSLRVGGHAAENIKSVWMLVIPTVATDCEDYLASYK